MFDKDYTDVDIIIGALKKEFEGRKKNGLYSLFQTVFAYHSNHIEGSNLTENQTAFLFDTGTLGGENVYYRVKDIEEAHGHFLMFDHMLKSFDEPLSEKMIKSFHYCLKAGVFEDKLNGYAIGEYKTLINRVGTITTAHPDEVPYLMELLISGYMNQKFQKKQYKDILRFHVEFEKIHPFQDGNGRVGRIIMFRECLKNDLFPIIIRDIDSMEYKHAVGIAQTENDISALQNITEKSIMALKEEVKPYIDNYRDNLELIIDHIPERTGSEKEMEGR